MWAWVSSTKSSLRTSKPGLSARWFLCRASGPPWNMPQSTRKRTSPASTRVHEPVTSPAAPRNPRRMFSILPTWRSMNLNKAECNARQAFQEVNMFKHIFVPTDGSELTRATAQRAVSFAKEAGARITVFFSKPEYPIAYFGEGALIDPTPPAKFAELADP